MSAASQVVTGESNTFKSLGVYNNKQLVLPF